MENTEGSMLPRQVDVRDVARAHVLAAEVRAQQKLQYLCTYALSTF